MANVDFVSEIERRYLECSVCTEIFNEDDHLPMLLPCQHTFCCTCLKKLFKRKCVKCPSCNTKHNLGQNGVIGLPKDNVRRDLTSFLLTQESSMGILRCSRCDNRIKIEVCYICFQCKVLFCKICRDIHKNKQPSHDIQVKSNDTKNEITTEVCCKSDHKNAPLKYFCTSCQVSVCPTCAFTDHRDTTLHLIEDISQAFGERKVSLATSLAGLRQKIQCAKSVHEKFTNINTSLKQQQLTYSSEINALYNKGVNILDQRKHKLLTHESKLFMRKEEEIFQRKEKITCFITNADKCCELSEQVIQNGTMSSFLQFHKILETEIGIFLNQSIDDMKNVATLKYMEDERELKRFENTIEMIDYTTKHDDMPDILQQTQSSRGINSTNDNNTATTFMKRCLQKIGRGFTKMFEGPYVIYVQREPPPNEMRIWWKIFACVALVIGVLMLTYMPTYIFFPNGFFTALRFSIHEKSDFQCRSSDNTTVSMKTKQLNWLTCGSSQASFIDNGLFANITLDPYLVSRVRFTVKIKNAPTDPKFYGHNIFSFGVKVGIKYDSYLQTFISGYICSENTRLCVRGHNPISKIRNIFTRKSGSSNVECSLILVSNPKLRSMSIFFNTENAKNRFFNTNFYFGAVLRPFVTVHNVNNITVVINFGTSDAIEFDRFSLFSSLFISDDNKTVSTMPSPYMKRRVEADTERSIYASLVQDTSVGHDIRSIIKVNFDKAFPTNATEYFEIGFGFYENELFIPLSKNKIIKCIHLNETNDCLQNRIMGIRAIITPGHLSMIVHFNMKTGVLKVITNTIIPYFEKQLYNDRLPVLYLRNLDSDTISANWQEDAYMYEGVYSLLYELL